MGTPFSMRDTANVSLNLCEWPFLISAISKSRRSVRSQTLKALFVLPVPFQKKYSGWICPISFSAESTTGGSKSRVYKQLILHVFGECRRGDLNPHGTRSRQILSLLRMPISPLRPTAQLLERNTFGMNQSTGPDSSSFPALNSRSLCQWVLFWVLTASNCFQFQVAAPLCSCCLAQDAHSIFPSK